MASPRRIRVALAFAFLSFTCRSSLAGAAKCQEDSSAATATELVGVLDMARVLRQSTRNYVPHTHCGDCRGTPDPVFTRLQGDLREQDRILHTEPMFFKRAVAIARRRATQYQIGAVFNQAKDRARRIEEAPLELARKMVAEAVDVVVKRRRLELLLEKQWVYYSRALDITDEVLQELARIELEHGKGSVSSPEPVTESEE